jgi:L-iditol 2-dehydrogenase
MKTAVVKESSVISINETENPVLSSGDILVQMYACGICGSDLEKVFGEYGQPSMKLGHEPAGIIIDVGSSVTSFKKGDRVFTHHHVPCYSCHLCSHGNETMCPKYYETNLSPCGLSEEYVVPQWNVEHGGVLKIPDSMSFEEAAMIEPLACCVRAWTKYSYREGDSIAIFGVGPTGMMHVMLAKSKKFSKIFCFDVNEFRLKFAKRSARPAHPDGRRTTSAPTTAGRWRARWPQARTAWRVRSWQWCRQACKNCARSTETVPESSPGLASPR